MRKKQRNIPKLLRRISYGILIFFVLLAVFSNIIANEKPLYVRYKGHTLFPAFTLKNNYIIGKEVIQVDITDWKHLKADNIIFAPVAYSPGRKDMLNADYKNPTEPQFFLNEEGQKVKMPLRFRHWLGTNKLGEDVLSGLIHGSRISMFAGVISMLFAGFLGLFLGSIAGFFGNDKLKTSLGMLISMTISVIIAWFYAIHIRGFVLQDALAGGFTQLIPQIFISIVIAAIIIFIFYFIGKLAGSKIPFLNKKSTLHVDTFILGCISILISIPRVMIIVTIAAIARPSLINLALIIGFTSWTGIARFVRAEMMKVRELDYISACRSLGFKNFRIIFHHALPNAIAPAITALAFGIASAILIESSLSFLGIGIPPETVSWGTMLAQGKEYFNAWWLVLFPGLAIFMLVLAFNLLGDSLQMKWNRKILHK